VNKLRAKATSIASAANTNQKARMLVEALSDLVAAVRSIERRTVEMQYTSPQLILSSENSRGV